MRALIIGGTGTISTEIVRLAAKCGVVLFLLNRGNSNANVAWVSNVNFIKADINDINDVRQKLKGQTYDIVVSFITFTPDDALRDISLFSEITKQYIFISSASAYQKPLSHYLINESTPLSNPYWDYSRNKIACEEIFTEAYRSSGFPVTIVRPSHTYDKTSIPLAVHGDKGPWQVVARILEGKPVVVHGDGTSLWTLTHSRDFAKAFVGLMGNIHAIGETVHITSDETLTWNQIYHSLGIALEKEPVIRHIASDLLIKSKPAFLGTLIGDKANSIVFDNSKIKRLVPDYVASIRFDEGIKESVRYFLENDSAKVPDPEFDEWLDRIIAAYDSLEI